MYFFIKKNILLSFTFFLIIFPSFAEKIEIANKALTKNELNSNSAVTKKPKKENLKGTTQKEQDDFWEQVGKEQTKLNKKSKYEYTICRLTVWPGSTVYPAAKVYGINLGLPASCNIARDRFSVKMKNDIYGIDMALFFTTASIDGIQAAPVIINVRETTGMQLSVGGYTEKLNGLQIALYNGTRFFNGIQIGLINSTYKANGLQIGLINVIENSIVPLCPFFNFSWF
ncbi:MAG: hypothetical protein GY756_21530 [bacterium]|nr:hypothetical protein [bacterium]